MQRSTEGDFFGRSRRPKPKEQNLRRPKPKVSKWGFFPIAQKSCGVSIYSEMHDLFRVKKLCFRKLKLIDEGKSHSKCSKT